MTKRVLLAAPRGYCAGVDRAVIAVEKALEHYGPPIYVRKEIVHNKHVVATLAARGAVFVDETDEVPEGERVVFSAHGVSPAVHRSAAERGLRTIDATCPLVTKVHKEAVRFADADLDILLIGHTGHEEVEGTAGEAPEHIQVVNSPDDVDSVVVRDPDKVVLAEPDHAERRRDDGDGPPAARAVPEPAGPAQRRHLLRDPEPPGRGQEDGAGVRPRRGGRLGQLLELRAPGRGRARGRRQGRRTGSTPRPRSTRRGWTGATTVGVTSGASVPEILVRDVLDRLAELGFGEVSEVRTATEDLMFSLPRELRADLKAAGKDDAHGRRAPASTH